MEGAGLQTMSLQEGQQFMLILVLEADSLARK
jgi:hypothetical protein